METGIKYWTSSFTIWQQDNKEIKGDKHVSLCKNIFDMKRIHWRKISLLNYVISGDMSHTLKIRCVLKYMLNCSMHEITNTFQTFSEVIFRYSWTPFLLFDPRSSFFHSGNTDNIQEIFRYALLAMKSNHMFKFVEN